MTSAYASMTCPYRMHLLQIRDHRDLHLDDLDRRDVELHQLMGLMNGMDQMLLHLLHLDVVQNLDALVRRHRQDAEHLDVQQNLDVVRQVVVHLDVQRPLVAVVGAVLRHPLRMDYFLDVEDVELLPLQRMDCCQDVVQLVRLELVVLELQTLLELQVHLVLLCMQQLQLMPPPLLHVMPSTLQDQLRARLQVLLRALD